MPEGIKNMEGKWGRNIRREGVDSRSGRNRKASQLRDGQEIIPQDHGGRLL